MKYFNRNCCGDICVNKKIKILNFPLYDPFVCQKRKQPHNNVMHFFEKGFS